MKKLADLIAVREHFGHYVNFRAAHYSHAGYIRDNELSDAVGELLQAAYTRSLHGENFSAIIREMNNEIIKLKEVEGAKSKRKRIPRINIDPELRRLVNEIARIKRVRKILQKGRRKKSR